VFPSAFQEALKKKKEKSLKLLVNSGAFNLEEEFLGLLYRADRSENSNNNDTEGKAAFEQSWINLQTEKIHTLFSIFATDIEQKNKNKFIILIENMQQDEKTSPAMQIYLQSVLKDLASFEPPTPTLVDQFTNFFKSLSHHAHATQVEWIASEITNEAESRTFKKMGKDY
jgi:hypothetical protein